MKKVQILILMLVFTLVFSYDALACWGWIDWTPGNGGGGGGATGAPLDGGRVCRCCNGCNCG